MPQPSRPARGRRRRLLPALAGLGGLALLAGALPAQAAPHDGRSAGSSQADSALPLANYDARTDTPGARRTLAQRDARAAATPKAGVTSLKHQLGTEGIVDIDPLTGTARQVAKTDGYLTAASSAAPADVALAYVRGHADVFGLSPDAVGGLTLRRDYVDVAGTHHLSFTQDVAGVPVFGNGLTANVASSGRLVSVLGSPVAHLPASAGTAKLSATAARDAAVRNAGRTPAKVSAARKGSTTAFADGDQARQVVFETLDGPRLAWQTLTTPAKGAMYLHVVDARTGRVLYRQDLVQHEAQQGLAWDNYPGATRGGKQSARNLTAPGWLPAGSDTLNGRNAHVYSDVNDNNKADASEEIHADARGDFRYGFTTFNKQNPGKGCSAAYPCSWDPNTPDSWQANRKQNAVQVFYFLGKYHDHLESFPIGFTRAAGNFDARDGDAVAAEPDDGADTADGLPDTDHTDNANMATPPDGTSPRMQMYLWNDPTQQDDGFIPSNGGDEADVVYHEYTHGLSNRLVVDANGLSTLGNVQAGSMGEAWSDWYAYDFLVDQGYFQDDARRSGDISVGVYVGHGDTIRTQPLDCAVGAAASVCPGTKAAGPGGYTYGDFGKISSRGVEVHADGEIWGETLWDLRAKVGSKLAESLVTRAMELSPANPSYLDERNAILMADTVVNGGHAHKAIWKVFAKRGMGYFAGALNGDDTQPVEDFSLPPAPGTPTGSLTGKVSSDTGSPVAGATVAFGGHASGYLTDFAGTTGADGTYTISGIPAGTYPKVFATGPGYEQSETRTISVSSHANTANWTLTRDWAAISGGASIADFNGPDFTPDCGPDGLYDTSQGHGWGSDVVGGTDGVGIDPRHVTVQLPVAVDISELRIDPSATCGDDQSATAGDYQVETSTDGTTWTVAAKGHFTPDAYHTYTTVPLTAGGTGVKYLRYTILGTQVKDYGISCAQRTVSGCLFADSTEVLVHGSPS
ncbi:MAG TPA: M36 family metallopeptidase [Actinocatenispora sp.]